MTDADTVRDALRSPASDDPDALAALFSGHELAVFGLIALPLLGNRRTR